jgi:hypothetical protein
MIYLVLIVALLCAWAFLRVLGGEREQRLLLIRSRVENNEPADGDEPELR